ncbi:TRAP transporter, 4TM/12TM fusion protein [Desulfacinum hydrothermale DSM 13146]|uniref:TRAP transporter, 4TM/12TM fusion protein n=1 Tax=Desulfacinum hydrothermale DSM 13146 TaxID=1121390 RepID=A0A1W1X833_9BACT|nr:TRAP transporter permease [Desulfacinum hydrothermale]SMC19661.1 TRAP transporter, 4TM/12TM fusion protein [Desulfacinum hydrothermale DSM 13146]
MAESALNRSLSGFPGTIAKVVTVVAVSLSLFQLYTAGLGAMTAMVQRSVHLGLILVLTFLTHPLHKKAPKDRWHWTWAVDLVLVAASLAVAGYIVLDLDGIFARQGDWSSWDVTVGILCILLVLEATRRVIGPMMMAIGVIFLLYGYFGPYMPDLIIHRGYSVERIATTLSLTTEGVFGLPIGVAATFVFIFILFGAFLDKTGGGNFFIDLAYSLTGQFSGGPAKTAVLASGFMGSVSGSAVANVVSTGSFTIPMMKRVGYRPHVAGAIEAAASTGGQLMPPIMGAGAFLMAEFTNTPYLHIIKVALIPAVLYYMTTLLFVHIEAKKEGLEGQPKEDLPKMGETLKKGVHFLIPLAILITVLLMNFSPMMAGFIAVVSVYATAMLRKQSRLSLSKLISALETGARNAVMVSIACAAAGIIVGITNLTGMGLRFSSMVVSLSHGIPLLAIGLIALASLALGMGLPVTASYIVLVILAGPALMDMGIPLITAHMIVFWYSQDANVTPPVSLASFAGAGIAGSSPMRTAFTSWKLAKGLYIIPVVMAYHPLLLNGPAGEVVRTIVGTALALLAFVVAMERYFLAPIGWVETALYAASAVAMIWVGRGINYAGMGLFALLVAYHVKTARRAKAT